MAGIQGRRKTMLFVSEGLDLDLNDQIGPRPGSQVDAASVLGNDVRLDSDLFANSSMEAALASQVAGEIRRTVEAVTRANVAVYSIDPRGLTDPTEAAMEFAGPPGEGAGAATTMMPTTALRRELRDSQQGLRDLAGQTGGVAIVGTNNFADGFKNIVEDSSTYYVLGYRTPPRYDGKFHEITVRVKRPGVQVRARKGYYALKEKPAVEPDVLHQLLTSPMALPGLTMKASSTVLRGTAPNGLLQFTLEFDEDLPFEDKGGTFANRVEISYLAADAEGNTKATASKTLDMNIRPEVREKAAEEGLRFATEMALPPGKYQIRLAAKESVSGKAGSVFWDVEIPDYASAPLTMSELVLSSVVAGQSPTVHDATTLKAMLPVPPTTGREFTLEDEITVFAEVYDRETAPHTMTLALAVKTPEGGDVFNAEDTRESTARTPDRQSYPWAVKVPLRDLVEGRFVISVTATSSTGQTTSQSVRIQIR
jgi:hypothetical protein